MEWAFVEGCLVRGAGERDSQLLFLAKEANKSDEETMKEERFSCLCVCLWKGMSGRWMEWDIQ